MKRYRLGWVLILWLALVLRLWGLSDHNIWWDEGYTVWLARMPVPQIIETTAHDVHPPGHYLLTRGWLLLMGDDEWTLRFPSAFAGVLTVALAGGFGRMIGRRRTGVLAATLVALSGFAVIWSQEIRMYSWATALTLAAMWAAARFWRSNGWRAWLAYVLASAAALLTIYLSAMALVVTNVGFLWFWWRDGRHRDRFLRWVAAQVAVLALCAPWLSYALPRMHSWSSSAPLAPGFFVRLYATLLASGVSEHTERWVWATGLVFVVFALGLLALFAQKHSAAASGTLVMFGAALVLPALLVYLLTIPGNSLFARPLVARYLLPLAPAFYLLLAWGLAALPRRQRLAATIGIGLTLAVAFAGLITVLSGRTQTDQYLSAAATVQAHRRERDAVLIYTDQDWPLFAARYAGAWHGAPKGMRFDSGNVDGLLAPLWAGADGIWLVSTPYGPAVDPQHLLPAWLESRAVASVRWDFSETSVIFYARTDTRAAALRDLAPDAPLPAGSPTDTRLLGAALPMSKYVTGDTAYLALYWAQVPDGEVQLTVEGPVERQVTAPAAIAAGSGPTRQVIGVPLSADLPSGAYRLVLSEEAAAGRRIEVGRFALVARQMSSLSAAMVTYPLDVRLGAAIRLAGYDLPQAAVVPGEMVTLTLYWEALSLVDARYKVFVHLVGTTWNAGSGNFLWGQQDREPVGNQLPTTQWAPGSLIADAYHVALDPAAPPGVYDVEVGMYSLTDGARLPVFDADGQALGDAVNLGQITIR